MERIVISGKRKTSVARAELISGTGKVTIDEVSHELLPNFKRLMIEEPLRIAKQVLGKLDYDISVTARGGGQESRIEAARLAVAKVLILATKSKELRKAFLAYDKNMVVADTRRKEACKPNDSKARAKRQKSYR